MSNQKLIDDLSESYDQMQGDIKDMKDSLRAKLKEDIAAGKLELEKAFALKFELARTAGVKRFELEMPVIKTKNGDRYRYFVELGGGELTRLRNSDERAEDRKVRDESAKHAIYAQHGATGDYVNEKGHLVVTFESGLHAYLHTYPDDTKQLLPTNGTDEHWQRFIRTQPEARTAIMNLLKEQN